MKIQTSRLAFIISLIISPYLINSQSTSVFDANYFNNDNAQPPIRVGKGFHINDVYKQTRSCFIPTSVDPSKLIAQQAGQKTFINLYYTQTEEDYSKLKTNGISGKVSFLNLFSLDGQKLSEFNKSSHNETHRLIFCARVDFGVFNFSSEPSLNDEAKTLIAQNKHEDFIKFFGTHYIDGVRKESSIWIILTEQKSSSESTEANTSSLEIGGKIPFRAKGSFEISEGQETQEILSSNRFSVSVEINGPSLEKNDIEKGISDVLNNNDVSDKIAGIKKVINGAISKISDPNQALISQYYYSPFTLHGVNGINWDAKKQAKLIKLNEAVINTYSTKEYLKDYVSPNAFTELEKEFDAEIPDFNKKNQFKTKYKAQFDESLPILKEYKEKLDASFVNLEKRYSDCSNISCVPETECCNNDDIIKEIETLDANIDVELDKLEEVTNKALEAVYKEIEKTTPECEKENRGYVKITNLSTNPYDIYQGDNFIMTLQGGYYKKFYLSVGTYEFQAKQQSGYIVYPTINKRTAMLTEACQEVTLKVGFED